MHQDRHEAMNEFSATQAGGQYVPPSASIPDEYWQAAAQAQVAARSSDASTVAPWAFVLLGLILPIFALLAGLWSTWMIREDSRFAAPAAVGFGIFLIPFLA